MQRGDPQTVQDDNPDSYVQYLGCECGSRGTAVFLGMGRDRKLLDLTGGFERGVAGSPRLRCTACGREFTP
jgi:hypothetical protein